MSPSPQTPTNSLKNVEETVRDVLLLPDEGVIKVLTASIVANRLGLDPVWLIIIGGSGTGKSELINMTGDLDFIHPISDLTTNTFASGLERRGEETSLLNKVNNGIMTFKDFTSVLSKHRDARTEIMGQMREIYDGQYTKRTGNAKDIAWRGRVGAVAASTGIIYKYIGELAAMGNRFMMYHMDKPDRIEVSLRAAENARNMETHRKRMRNAFKLFVEHVLKNIDIDDIEIKQETKERIVRVADLTARVRSGISKDSNTGEIDFVPDPEVGTRITQQLMTMATAFIAMNRADESIEDDHAAYEGQLTEDEIQHLFKIGFTSIPKTRRDVLMLMAEYENGVMASGVSQEQSISTNMASQYLRAIDALGVGTKSKHNSNIIYHIKEKWRDMVLELEDKKPKDAMLEPMEIARIDDRVEDEDDDGFGEVELDDDDDLEFGIDDF